MKYDPRPDERHKPKDLTNERTSYLTQNNPSYVNLTDTSFSELKVNKKLKEKNALEHKVPTLYGAIPKNSPK